MRKLGAESTVLVVIDVQERLASVMPSETMRRVVRGIELLLEGAHQLGGPVLATEQYPKGLGHTVSPIAQSLAMRGIVPVEKITFSAVATPAFSERLDLLPVRAAVVVGLETHVCVFQTVRQLVERGLEVYVPIDGVASRREDHRLAGLALCERAGAFATTCETVVFDWLGEAGTEAFRTISKIVRQL